MHIWKSIDRDITPAKIGFKARYGHKVALSGDTLEAPKRFSNECMENRTRNVKIHPKSR